MNTKHLGMATLSIMLALSACATADFTPTESGQMWPEYRGNVAVLERMPPAQTYDRIGVVVAKGGLAHDSAEMTRAMKERAAQMGANTIVIVKERHSKPGAFLALQPVMESSAVAIRMRTPQ